MVPCRKLMKFEGNIASVCDYLEISSVFNETLWQLLLRFKVTGIECDSRRVTKGTIFYARKGAHYDPFAHLEEIKAKGAVAVLIDAPEEIKDEADEQELQQKIRSGNHVNTHYISDKEASVADYHATDNTPEAQAISAAKMVRLVLPRHKSLSALAGFIFGEPSQRVRVIGVTGTNGKSTITHLIAQMLNACGHKCAVFGTLGFGFLGQFEHTPNTTLDAITLQRELKHYADLGAEYVVMEVSSIGFCEGRVAGVHFYAGGFSNLSRDHLDYHLTMEDYFTSKLNFLRMVPSSRLVINCQYDAGRRMAEAIPNCYEVTLSKERSDNNLAHALNIKRINYLPNSLELFVSKGERSTMRTEIKLLGEFNAENYAVALGIMLAMGYDYKFLLRESPKLRPITGRMECFTTENMPRLIVDYAHTPDGVEQALKAVQSHSSDNSRIFVVLGCGGDRDKGKRPIMATKASVYADYAIFTADNPRTESLSNILEDMMLAIVPQSCDELIEQKLEAGEIAPEVVANWQERKQRVASYLQAKLDEVQAQIVGVSLDLLNYKGVDVTTLTPQQLQQKQQWQREHDRLKKLVDLLQQSKHKDWIKAELGSIESTDPNNELLRCDFDSDQSFEEMRRQKDSELVNHAPSNGDYAQDHPVLIGLPVGLPHTGASQRNVVVLGDRYQAIRFAFEHARKQDCVLIAGKGHEDYQLFANDTIHFSDREICCELLGIKLPEQQEAADQEAAANAASPDPNSGNAVTIKE